MPDWKKEIEKQLADLKLEPMRESEILEELSQHLEDRYRGLLLGGAVEADAHRIAFEELCGGNLLAEDLKRSEQETNREVCIAAGSKGNRMLLDYGRSRPPLPGTRIPIGKWLSDVRYAWRSLSVRRGSSLATVLVFALGVGLAAAMFALTDPYISRPLSFKDPGRLVLINLKIALEEPDARIPTLDDWRARTDLFRGVAAMGASTSERLRLPNGAVNFSIVPVTEDFFDVLGVPAPRSGAWRPGADASVMPIVLTPAGRSALAANLADRGSLLPGAAGTSLRIDGVVSGAQVDSLFTAIKGKTDGLAPYKPDAVVERWWSADRSSTSLHRHTVIARLQPGVAPQDVEQALALVLPSGRKADVAVERLADRLAGKMRPLAYGAFGAGLLVLLVCAGNVANLFVARGAYRAKEFAVREALGAARSDIGRLWLIELALTAALGVIAGIAIAWTALAVAARAIPVEYARLGPPALTSRVAFFAALSGGFVVVAGLIPARLVGRLLPRALLGQHTSAPGSRLKFLRFAFGALQAALAMVLAVGAAMLVQSYLNLKSQNPGYDPDAIVVPASYPAAHGPVLDDTVQASIRRLRSIPGVQAVSATTRSPMLTGTKGGGVSANGKGVFADFAWVMPGFFDAAGVPLLQGRPLQERDRGWRAVVVNQEFARKAWPGAPAVGRILAYEKHQAEVVGVAGDAFDLGLAGAPRPTVYILQTDSSWASSPSTFARDWTMVYVLRASGAPDSYGERIRRALSDVDRDAVISAPTTVGACLSDSVRSRTFATLVLVLFSIAGAAVAIAGLVGIVTFVIARRTKEMAIRMALGAGGGHIRRLAIQEAASAAFIGGTAGLLAGRWLSKWLESLMFGLTAGNWTTALIAGAVMFAVMLAAALLPARRAVRLQPTEALRVE